MPLACSLYQASITYAAPFRLFLLNRMNPFSLGWILGGIDRLVLRWRGRAPSIAQGCRGELAFTSCTMMSSLSLGDLEARLENSAAAEAPCRFTPLCTDQGNTFRSWKQQKVLIFFCRLRNHVGNKAERGRSTRCEIQAAPLHSQSPPTIEVPVSATIHSFSFPHGHYTLYYISEKHIQVLGTKCPVSSNKSYQGHMRHQMSKRDIINHEALSETEIQVKISLGYLFSFSAGKYARNLRKMYQRVSY